MEQKQLLLKKGTVYTADAQGKVSKLGKGTTDIRIKHGSVADVSEQLSSTPDDLVIDLTGLTVLPGFTDVHTHLRDFDQSDVEDFGSGARAAAAGGFTTIVAMANTVPPRDNVASLKDSLERIRKNSCIEVLPAAAVTKKLAGVELTNMGELADNGALVFSDDGQPITNLAVLRRALEYIAVTNSLIISHAEDKDLTANGVMNESPQSVRMGLPGIPAASEAAAVAREIEVLRLTGGRLHFTHVSTAPSIALVRRAKADGLKVTADVTPHHLALKDEDIVSYDANFKMNPPLRSRHDQEALFSAIADGTIDAIATDHAPWSALHKSRPFEHCSLGVIGLETAFPLMYELLVRSQLISFERLIEMLTVGPATILSRPFGQIAIGHPANIAIVDLNQRWLFDVNKSQSKSRNSPFHGRELLGKSILTFFKGQVAYRDQQRLKEFAPLPVSGH
jgi:dihydroorotase